jgi:hypothetical protein
MLARSMTSPDFFRRLVSRLVGVREPAVCAQRMKHAAEVGCASKTHHTLDTAGVIDPPGARRQLAKDSDFLVIAASGGPATFLYTRLRRRRTKPNQRRAGASNAKLAGSGTASALAVGMTPIGSEARFTG